MTRSPSPAGTAPRRVVDDPEDPPLVNRRLQLAFDDVVAQVLGHVGHVLDDAVVHVDDVERAVRGSREVDGTEPLVGRGQELRLVVGLPPRSAVPSSLTMIRLMRLPAGSATKTFP